MRLSLSAPNANIAGRFGGDSRNNAGVAINLREANSRVLQPAQCVERNGSRVTNDG
jgi:hypothetical protein